MTVLNVVLEVDVAIVADATYVAPYPVAAMPPSSSDAVWDEMRIAVGLNGVNVSRAFDPGEPIVTGAPIVYVTKSGEPYVTKSGEPYVTKVAT